MSRPTSCANVPAERAICPPRPGRISILWMIVPIGIADERHRIARLHVDALAGDDIIADIQTLRRKNVSLLAVRIFDQCDEGCAVGIIFDPLDLRLAYRTCGA